MSLTTMITNGVISSKAAFVLEKYEKDQNLEEVEDVLTNLPKKIKKEIWVGALALGFIPILKKIFSYDVIYSPSFGHTIRKLQDCFNLKTDQEKIFHFISTIRKVEKVQRVLGPYSCVIKDYTFVNHILNELCRYDLKWERIVKNYKSKKHDKSKLSLMEKCHKEKHSFQWSSFYPSYAKQKMESAIEECGLHLSEKAPDCKIDKILDGRNKWRTKVSQEVGEVLQNYFFKNVFPSQGIDLTHKEELWLAAFSLGQTYLMRFLFNVDEMNSSSFGMLLKKINERVDFDSQYSQWLLALLILAQCHQSRFNKYNEKWIIGQSFLEFLVQHKEPLKDIIEAFLKDLNGKELELIRPNQELECFYHPSFFCFLDHDYKVSINKIEDLKLLFKEVFISKVRFSFSKLQHFSSTPEILEERINKSKAQISQETAQFIFKLTHTNALNWQLLIDAPQGTIQTIIQAAEKLGLDLLLDQLKNKSKDLGFFDITEKNKVNCREILLWTSPQTLLIKKLGWLDLLSKDSTKRLSIPANTFNSIGDIAPCLGITHLNLSDSGEVWSPNEKTLEKVFPKAKNIAFEYQVYFNSFLPKNAKNIVIEGYPMSNRYDKEALIGLENLSFVQKLALNRGQSTRKVGLEDDQSFEIFNQLSQLSNLHTLYIHLPQDVRLEAFAFFKKSSLKKLYVDRYENEIQMIVGAYIKVEKGSYSAFNDFCALKKM